MAAPTGIGYAAGALSQAISDVFKGMNEGEEERRKEEEAGRRVRSEITEQAYQPIRFKQGILSNQQLEQSMRLADSQEAREQAAEKHRVATRPLELRGIKARTETDEATAQFAYKNAQTAYDTAVSNLKKLNHDIKLAEISEPYFVPRLKAEQKKLATDLETAKYQLKVAEYNWRELNTLKSRRAQIGAELVAAGLNPVKVAEVLSRAEPGLLPPTDPYMQFLDNWFKLQAVNGQNSPNQVQLYTMKSAAYQRAINEAQQDAKTTAGLILGEEALKRSTAVGDNDIAKAVIWLQQYHQAMRLREAEKDPTFAQYGISFLDQQKAIPPVPKGIIEGMARQPGLISELWNGRMQYETAKKIAERAGVYMQQGVPMSLAWDTAFQELEAAKKAAGIEGTKPMSATAGAVEDWGPIVRHALETAAPGVGAAVQSILGGKKEIPLPPPVKTQPPVAPVPSAEAQREMRLDQLARQYFKMSWWHLSEYPGMPEDARRENAKARQELIEIYESEQKNGR